MYLEESSTTQRTHSFFRRAQQQILNMVGNDQTRVKSARIGASDVRTTSTVSTSGEVHTCTSFKRRNGTKSCAETKLSPLPLIRRPQA